MLGTDKGDGAGGLSLEHLQIEEIGRENLPSIGASGMAGIAALLGVFGYVWARRVR